MKTSLLRLAKLRHTQHRQAKLWAGRIAADLQATQQCAQEVMQAHRQIGTQRPAYLYHHDEFMLGCLQSAAQKLTADLERAHNDLRERAREAKQMQTLVDNQRQAAAERRERAEIAQIEAWGRNRQSTSPLMEVDP